ncbi:MAG: hydrogenase nickel incorporation protein HypB [Bacteroidota bacterium]
MHIIDVNSQILQENSRLAEVNKKLFEKYNLHVTNFMSAPGAGKTSVLEETIKKINGQFKISVIEGDLQTSIDSDRIKALDVPSYQITTGTVCHLDARMIHNALHDFNLEGNDLLFIENVGNLVCPADFELGEKLKVMVFSVVEGAEKPKKYPVMFHTVDVVLLNKIDLIPYSGVSLDELKNNVQEVNPTAKIFTVSCRTGEGIDEWVEWFLQNINNK